MKRFFLHIYNFFKQKTAVMWCVLIGILILCGLGILHLNFVEDISSFLPSDSNNERVNYAYEHLGGDNKIVVYVGMADTTQDIDITMLTTAVDQMAEILATTDSLSLIKELRYIVDYQQVAEITNFVIENMPYFLTEEDYARMDTMLTAEQIRRQLATDKQLLTAPIPMMRDMIRRDPLFFTSSLLKSLNSFKLDDSYYTEEDHIFSKDGKEAILVVSSNLPMSETQNNAILIRSIDDASTTVTEAFNGNVRIHSFGASQVSLTNARQIKKDSFTAIALELIFIFALLIYYYRNARSILLIFVSILFGGVFALGIIAVIKNPVSVIAIGVASIIIGIAINYPIHVLSHFKRTDDKERIIKEIVTPLLIGNITTVGAFLSLLFISSPAMKDLGLFSALLLLGTILFVLVFLPHLMGETFHGKSRGLAFRHIAEFRPENIRGLFWLIVVCTLIFYFFSKKTSFDTNMHHINYMTKEQQAEFDKLRQEADTSTCTLYCIAEGCDYNSALCQYEKALPTLQTLSIDDNVKRISYIATFIPSKEMQQIRLHRWNSFWENRREDFIKTLDEAAMQNGYQIEAFQPCKEIIGREYAVRESNHFDLISKQMAGNYISHTAERTLIYSILSVNKNASQHIEKQLNNIGGDIYAFTDSSIASRLVGALSHDFNYVLYICGIIVFAFLLFTFGRFEISITAFLPLFTAWIWILGLMAIFGIQFNIVNIILATFIFGMGDDYSIFVTEGLIYEYAYGRKMLAQFKNSIILSASIMFIGIGMLIFAKHPAMRSLAEVTIIGMISVVLMAYTLPPIIFKWITSRKGKPRRYPVTFECFLRDIIGFPYFFFGVVILSVCGFFLLRIGKSNDKNKLRYHTILQQLMHSTANVIPQSNYRILNPYGEDFKKPAVIICNHQSHFDLLYTLSLHPKLIVLTNDWAWNFPLYRRILRNADYLPTSSGMGDNMPEIKSMVEKGYSVLVFPEGTRSVDHSILRFHQGAFHIAEQLGLDILPIIMHGVGDMFPKNDPFIHRGNVTISIRKRILPNDSTFRKDKTSLETARLFRHYYINEYENLKMECETPDYLEDIVYHNYLYKGREIQLKCKQKLRNKEVLAAALQKQPTAGRLLYKNCGNGELSLMAGLMLKNVAITAYDADEECVAIASNCTSVPNNLHYTNVLPDETTFDYIVNEKDFFNNRKTLH